MAAYRRPGPEQCEGLRKRKEGDREGENTEE